MGIDLGIADGSEIISDHHLGWCFPPIKKQWDSNYRPFLTLPETKSLTLKIGGWKTILAFWVLAYFHGRLLAVKVTIYHLFT